MREKKSQRKFIVSAVAALLAIVPIPVWAISIVPECARVKASYGDTVPVPQLTCMMETFGNIALLILGATGSFALLMFVYGGFMIVLSAGDAGRVTKGKTIIRNAVIGILIIMTSGIVLQYGLKQLGVANTFKIIGQPCKYETTGQDGKEKEVTGVFVQNPGGEVTCEAPKKT